MKAWSLLSIPLAIAAIAAHAHGSPSDDRLPQYTAATLVTTPLVIEGLTNDAEGNLYAPGRNPGVGLECPVYRISLSGSPAPQTVGRIPAATAPAQCSPSGLAFDSAGKLYVAEGSTVWVFTPNATTPPLATAFATGVPGTNGLAFDHGGNLWTGDGTTGQGRVWRITPQGVVAEIFRIQPAANELNPDVSSGVANVGRDYRTLPPGTITVTPTSRNASNTLGSQPLVANGLAFDRQGNLFIADTARGAIWMAQFDRDGTMISRQGCDTTFHPATLCMENLFVAHPLIEGIDGIALDVTGGIWVSANERNALVYVERSGRVIEIFRNLPDGSTKLRNTGPLESPTSPVVVGTRVCTSNSDGARRDNFPATAGEIGGPGQPKGKVVCLLQAAPFKGMDLPVR